MLAQQEKRVTTATGQSSLADLLERILDKGLVISGDIRVRLVDIELLTLEIRLVVCSVDKAIEMGIDWWSDNPVFSPRAIAADSGDTMSVTQRLDERIERLEARMKDAK